MALMEAVWPGARPRVAEEVADMQALADAAGAGIRIEPWDYRFYAEKVRKDKYDFDQTEVKPYLQLESMREAMFWVAGELLGLAFTPRADMPVCPPRRARVGSGPRRRKARRALVLRSLRSRRQALGRVDERVPQPGALRRRGRDPRLQQRELHPAGAGRAGAPRLGRRAHALPRVRPRAARAVLERALSRRSRAPRSMRDFVEFPSQLLEHWLQRAGRAGALRAPLPDRRADARAAGGKGRSAPRASTRASTRSSTSRARSWT